jgi:hypothetical protein
MPLQGFALDPVVMPVSLPLRLHMPLRPER